MAKGFAAQVAAVRDQLTDDIEAVSKTIQSDQDAVFRLNAHIASIQARPRPRPARSSSSRS